jgi:formylglycine-generating enzyme required for sulfatase activity
VTLAVALLLAAGAATVRVPAGTWQPFFVEPRLKADAGAARPSAVAVPAFLLDVRPVTQAEFLEFVRANPQWRRSRTPRVFADAGYLRGWESDLALPKGAEKLPVTDVSWFAAKAYCRSRGAQLPTVAQWERAAVEEGDARKQTTAHILEWYGRPATAPLEEAGSGAANSYGVRDLHGLIWEWVLDFNDSMVAEDQRDDKGGDAALFCGSGAARAVDPADYATSMRYAFRSSLKATYAVRDLGFRCAREP